MNNYWYVRRKQKSDARDMLYSAIQEQKHKLPTSKRVKCGVVSFIMVTTKSAKFSLHMDNKTLTAWIKLRSTKHEAETNEMWAIRFLENNPIYIAKEIIRQNIKECPGCGLFFYEEKWLFQNGTYKYCPRCGLNFDKYLDEVTGDE